MNTIQTSVWHRSWILPSGLQGRNADEQVKMIQQVEAYNASAPQQQRITVSVEIEKTRDPLYQLFPHADVVRVFDGTHPGACLVPSLDWSGLFPSGVCQQRRRSPLWFPDSWICSERILPSSQTRVIFISLLNISVTFPLRRLRRLCCGPVFVSGPSWYVPGQKKEQMLWVLMVSSFTLMLFLLKVLLILWELETPSTPPSSSRCPTVRRQRWLQCPDRSEEDETNTVKPLNPKWFQKYTIWFLLVITV